MKATGKGRLINPKEGMEAVIDGKTYRFEVRGQRVKLRLVLSIPETEKLPALKRRPYNTPNPECN